MRIVNGVLEKVESSDIVNGFFDIPDGVTSIGESAFHDCRSLENINIQEGVTSIGEAAFYNCDSLKSVNIPKSVTSIGETAFCGCQSLENINIQEGVTSIGESAFYNCDSLKSINIPKSVTSIGESAFYNCKSLKSVNIPKGVTSIEESTFSRCQLLKNVNIPESVTSIGKFAFSDCISLESINLPKSVTNIGESAFSDCLSLESINIKEGITYIENRTFHRCESLINVSIPKGVTSIGEHAFFGCKFLESVSIPEGVTSIGKSAFSDCLSLENINIPSSVTSIGESAFCGCQLENVSIPKGVISIGKAAFFCCDFLESVIIPDSVTSIGDDAFYSCQSLENINLKEGVTSIGHDAFYDCQSLKSINIPSSVISIGKRAFDKCNSLSSIGINNHYISLENINHDDSKTSFIIKNYLYLYANSLLKEKYENIEDFLSNENISKIFEEDMLQNDTILKFKNIFYKMRKQYDVDAQLFVMLDLDTTKNFDFKTWNEIKNIYNWKNSIEMTDAFSEMIEIFGLFHKDSKRQKRVQQFKDLFCKRVKIPKEFYLSNPKFEGFFKEVTVTSYVLKDGLDILEEYAVYLTDRLSEEVVKRIKKLSGTYGKQLNDFVKKSYVKTKEAMYELIDSSNLDVVNELFSSNITEYLNYHNLHQMFDGCNKRFDEDFYLFLIDNLPFILKSEKLQASVKNIESKFENIKNYYLLHSGVKDVTLVQAINYIDDIKLICNKGNYELLLDAKKAGVVNQEAFDYYQNVYEKNDIRRLYSLVRRSNIYEIDGYTIKAELLRKDDSFGMLIGEKNYTNCCQVFGGVGHNCMAHAVNSDDGGIFVTRLLKDGQWILLTESWDWQNNNVYCHDNIEGTEYFKKGSNNLKKAVAEVIRLDGEYIIEKSRESVSKYVECRKKILDKSLSVDKDEELKKLRELENKEVIQVVTCGSENDDLEVSKYYKQSIYVYEPQIINGQKFVLSNFQPANYNERQAYFDPIHRPYTDSRVKQVIVAGSIEDLCSLKIEKLVPIYRDDRRLVLESNDNIRDYTINKITNMEQIAYPEVMRSYQGSSKGDFIDNHIYLGEDWYLVYEEKENNSIYISDLAKVEPSIEDEKTIQYKEMVNTIYGLIRKYDFIDADLKEDTSYLLYLMNKKLGYLEQVGEDVSYPFTRPLDKRGISDEEQEEFLRQMKSIKDNKNSEPIMHKVKFKRGRL